MTRRRAYVFALGLTVVLGALAAWPIASVLAQQRVGLDGHALDANLQFGSGGFNYHTRGSGLSRNRYQVGSSRPLYVARRDGSMRYSPNNAFSPRSRYRATSYRRGQPTHAWHRRVRYGR